jgi:hypothetical protein
MKRIIPLLILGALFSLNSKAQEVSQQQELVTDRPDATEAPTVVPVGSLQVETGGLYTSFKQDGLQTEQFTYNTSLLRFGVLERLEMRVGWNLESIHQTLRNNTISKSDIGLSPLLLGVKVAIAEEKGWKPEIGLIGHVFLPFTANKDTRPETTGTDFRFAFNHTLSDRSGIAYNLGAQFFEDVPGAAYVYTFAYGYSFTDRFAVYGELYGDLPENFSANHFWDAGVTYLVSPLMQLDATIGQSITEGQDILVSVGLSFRIDKK